MEQLIDICIRSGEIFILLLGIIGLGVSFLLLFSPGLTRSAGRWLDRYVNVDGKIIRLNHYVHLDRFIYRHNLLFGLLMILGSLLVLLFLFIRLPGMNFHNIVFEILTLSAVLAGKIGSMTGIFIGLGLMFFPEKMRAIENKMNVWFDLQPYIDKLNKPHHFLEQLLLRHSVIFGMTGVAASAFLILVAVIGLSGAYR